MNILIAYYSRTGITRKACSKLAEILEKGLYSAHLLEIIDETSRKGIAGWVKGASDAMKKRSTDIRYEPVEIDQFDLIVIATPVWCFTMAPAVRTFIIENRIHIKSAAFMCTLGGRGDAKTLGHMQDVLESPPKATLALIDKYVKKNNLSEYLDKLQNFAREITA